ncbi:MAG TPA: glycosyltransferase, partial [Terrimesophilobacter sp.]|nr:glycosyltransferase [Terrimesophilobacter sp.]
VVMVTRLVPLKRVDHVIRAVAALRERGVAARLEVLGEGPAQGDLEALIAELGVSDAVVLRGHVPDPAAHVARAAVSVLSSTYEGQPLAVLESLMQGVPVVAYDINYGPRDMIDHGENGLLVPAGDVNALTDALGRVLDDPELRSRLAVGARTTAARLGPSAVMQRWGALFRDVLP